MEQNEKFIKKRGSYGSKHKKKKLARMENIQDKEEVVLYNKSMYVGIIILFLYSTRVILLSCCYYILLSCARSSRAWYYYAEGCMLI